MVVHEIITAHFGDHIGPVSRPYLSTFEAISDHFGKFPVRAIFGPDHVDFHALGYSVQNWIRWEKGKGTEIHFFPGFLDKTMN